MTNEVKVPMLPESVADATIIAWHVKEGDGVSRDQNLVDLETDKVVLEVPAPSDGVISKLLKQEGDTVTSGELLAQLDASAKVETKTDTKDAAPAEQSSGDSNLSPAVRRLVSEHNVDVSTIKGTGKGGRIIKEDVMKAVSAGQGGTSAPAATASVASTATSTEAMGPRSEKRVPMTRLRARIAERLVQAQQEAAMLTTFNEVDLSKVMALRSEYKDKFEKEYGVRLGFMSFFAKAAVEALKRYPEVNASIDGNDVVYHGYYDIGVAVSTERGLVVPVVRDVDQKSMAEIEAEIMDYAIRARDGKLGIEEMQGGTFTLTNGGVFGSLLSTPILNPPQTAILGMHKIEKRPVVVNDEVVVRPMMYLAMSYDHRLIDGKQSVQFLVCIKDMLEDPARLVLSV